jgi:two-component sensor histidine kinase
LTPFVLWGSQLFPIGQRNWPKRLLLHAIIGIICATTVIVFMIPILERIHQKNVDWILVPAPSGSVELAAHLLGFRFVIYLIVYWTIVGVSHALAYYRKYREGQMHAILLESRLAQTQLQMLKMQLQPHFLFNTLNAISSLMHQDVELADQMLARLGQLLRATLESAGTQEVAFKHELEFVELYLEIEQARFGPRLEVHIDAEPETMDACVPNLILQPLVENAIRHGISPRAGTGHIEIRAQRLNGSLQVQVLDDGPGLRTDPPAYSREGVGLSNTRERLRQLYGEAHQFTLANRDEGGVVVTLRVPYREGVDDHAPLFPGNGGAQLRSASPSFLGISPARSL